VAESKLAKFVEDIIIPPRMVDVLVDGEVYFFFMNYFSPPILHKLLPVVWKIFNIFI